MSYKKLQLDKMTNISVSAVEMNWSLYEKDPEKGRAGREKLNIVKLKLSLSSSEPA